jgi:MerR family transcriptional regulator, light-induced transcriptional regulator
MTDLGEDVVLDLSEAARELGVHYQTAYRWVREGALRAVKVGKSYRVQRRDLDRFVQRRESGTAPRPIQVRNWGHQIDRLHEALRRNDERSASDQVDRLAKGGVSPVELCDDLFAPVLRRIGEEWAAGAATVADEHRASAMCERLLARLPTRRTRVRGTAVVGTRSGEHHALPAPLGRVACPPSRGGHPARRPGGLPRARAARPPGAVGDHAGRRRHGAGVGAGTRRPSADWRTRAAIGRTSRDGAGF